MNSEPEVKYNYESLTSIRMCLGLEGATSLAVGTCQGGIGLKQLEVGNFG